MKIEIKKSDWFIQTPTQKTNRSNKMLTPIDAAQKKRLGDRPLRINSDVWNALSFWNASVLMVDIYQGEEISDNKSITMMNDHQDQSVRRVNRHTWTKRVIDAGWGKKDGFRAFMGNSATNFPKMKGKSYGYITLEEITDKILAHRAELKVWLAAKSVEKSVVVEKPVEESVAEPSIPEFVGLEEVDDWENL